MLNTGFIIAINLFRSRKKTQRMFNSGDHNSLRALPCNQRALWTLLGNVFRCGQKFCSFIVILSPGQKVSDLNLC